MTNDSIDGESEKTDGKPWPCHSSQDGLIKELLDAGITVGLTFEVKPKSQPTDA